jgi:HEAT repeat protein
VLEQRSEQEYVRGNAAWALGRIGRPAEPAIPLLIETLQSRGHVSVRRNSAEALGNFGPAAKAAVPRLVTALTDDDMLVRVNAALALWRIERHPKAVPALVEMLQRGDAAAAYQAAVALGSINVSGTGHHAPMVGVPLGNAEKSVAPALVEAFRHPDADVRRVAARSAGQLGPAVLPTLEKPLADRDEDVRSMAVEALGWMGPEAVAPLARALKDKAPAPRRAAARALGRMGLPAKAAESALLDAVNDPDNEVRDEAAKALRRIRS